MATSLSAMPATASLRPSASQVSGARSWYQHIISDLRPLDASLVSGLQAASQWQNGQESGPAAAKTMAADITDLRQALGNLTGQKPLQGHAGALVALTASVTLYLQAFVLEEAATRLAPGPLVTQLQRSFTRVRQLGDVTFDVGTTELAPLLGTALSATDVQAAHTLPNWIAEDLAPGPPLEASWLAGSGTSTTAPPSQGWAVALRTDGAPTPSALRRALSARGGATSRLAALAQSLQRAELRLSSVAGPTGAPEAAAVLQLGLLVDTEAALAAEASRLTGAVPDHVLGQVGSSLATVGSDLRRSATTKTTG